MTRVALLPLPDPGRRSPGRSGPGAAGAQLLRALLCAAALAGCSPFRYRLAGEEAGKAAALFAGASGIPYPIVASFSGTAEVSGRVLPFVAGVRSRGPAEETVGFYDPMGRAVLFLTNDGERVTVRRGPAAGEFPPENLPPILAGPVSLGRILAGAPGYPVQEGEAGRTADGGWAYRDGRQTLYSDAGRRHLARAEYGVSGTRITVIYPGRESSAPPGRVDVEIPGTRILLRRDAE